MTFTDYYFNGSSAWYREYINEGEQAYIELYGLEEEAKEERLLDQQIRQKQRARSLRYAD